LGELRTAIEHMDKALDLDPNDARSYYNKGNTLMALG